jgi:ribonuclease P protein component
MLSKKARVTKSDFTTLSKRSLLRAPLFDIAYVSAETCKVACVISKKRVKRSVDRNRIRRKIYEAFVKTGYNKPYVLIIYPQAKVLHESEVATVMQLGSLFATLP